MSLQSQPEADRQLVPVDESQAASVDQPEQGTSSSAAANDRAADGHPFVSRSQQGAAGTSRSPRSTTAKACTVHIKEPASETRDYVKPEETHGPLHRAIPVMPLGLAILCCVLNILLPGIGTFVAAFSCLHSSTTTRLRSNVRAFGVNIAVAVLQLATFIVIVGWIWSILWGMTFVQLAISEKRSSQGRRASMSYYVRRHSSVVV